MTTRARSMPPDERRAELVRIVLELVDEAGDVPSTAAIAQRAGIAEGTIFRAWGTKEALLGEAVDTVLCPAALVARIDAVDARAPLRDRLIELTTLLVESLRGFFESVGAFRLPPGPPPAVDHSECVAAGQHVPGRPALQGHDHHTKPDLLHAACLRLVEADADALRITPVQLVHYLRMLTFSGSHDHVRHGTPMTPTEMVDLLLTGALRPDGAPRPPRKAHP